MIKVVTLSESLFCNCYKTVLALINEQSNNNYSLILQIDIILIIDIFLSENIFKGWLLYERKEYYLTNRIGSTVS